MKRFKEFYLFEAYSAKVVKLLSDKFKKENPALTDTQIKYYIDRFEKVKSSPKIEEKDIMKYSFKELEHVIDSNFPREIEKTKSNDIDSKDSIYNENGLTIFNGDTREKCVKYGHGEKWCISRKDTMNMFNSYRYKFEEMNFYFIFDSERNDEFSKVVLLVDKDGNYYLANKDNSDNFAGGKIFKWDEITQHLPKIKNIRSLFQPLPLTDKEKEEYAIISVGTDEDLFKKFKKYDLVEKYISFLHPLTGDQFNVLPNELKLKYINTGAAIGKGMVLTEKEWLRHCAVQMQARNDEISIDFNGPLPSTFKLPDVYIRALTLLFWGDFPDGFKFPEKVGNLNTNVKTLSKTVIYPKEVTDMLAFTNIEKIPDGFVFPVSVGKLLTNSIEIGNNVVFPQIVKTSFGVRSIVKVGKGVKWPKEIGNDQWGYANVLRFKDEEIPKGFEFPEADFAYVVKTLPDNFKFPKKMFSFLFGSLRFFPKGIIFPDIVEKKFVTGVEIISDNVNFPVTVGGDFDASVLKIIRNATAWPETIGGDFDLSELVTINADQEFPKTIGGDFNLCKLKGFDPKARVEWPEKVKGNFNLRNLMLFPANSSLPKEIGGDFFLTTISNTSDLEEAVVSWPKSVGGSIFLRKSSEGSYFLDSMNKQAKESHDKFKEEIEAIIPQNLHKKLVYNHPY